LLKHISIQINSTSPQTLKCDKMKMREREGEMVIERGKREGDTNGAESD